MHHLRAREGLHADFQEQPRELQEEIGFEYIRFHGMFYDDMPCMTRTKTAVPCCGSAIWGLCVGMGGAVCGDDALAMCIAHVTGVKVQWAYLITSCTVLALSVTYIPLERLMYSLLPVVLSGQIIGWMQKAGGSKS